MPIKVHFRGPMLFVTDDASGPEAQDVVNRVLIPDATAAGKHEDGSSAKPHVAGLLLIEPGRPRAYIPLAGRTVEIVADGETGAPGVDAEYLKVPPIHDMTNPSGAKTPPVRRRGAQAPVAATVTLTGGSMSGEMVSKTGIELARHKAAPVKGPVASMPVWRSKAATGQIRITGTDGSTETIKLENGVTAYIFNWDEPYPTPAKLEETVVMSNTPEDEDFKWVYGLLEPDGKTWKQWLDGEAQLPAPRFIVDTEKGFTPPLSTCNSARARGMNPA